MFLNTDKTMKCKKCGEYVPHWIKSGLCIDCWFDNKNSAQM